jgi:hypothetical protein
MQPDPDSSFHFDADLDPTFHFDVDPDPTTCGDVDPDLGPHQSDSNLRP